MEDQVQSVLRELEAGLAEDGFRLRLAAVREGEVEVVLEAQENACWDCLVPDDLLVEMVRGAVVTVAPELQRVVLKKAGPGAPAPAREGPLRHDRSTELGGRGGESRRPAVLVCPLGEGATQQGGKRARRLDSLAGKRVALVATGKVNSDRFLSELGERLRGAYGVAETRVVVKPNPSVGLPEEVARDLAAWADAVVVGPGDCGSCSAASMADGIRFEELGVPSAVVITKPFVGTAEAFARVRGGGVDGVVVVDHPVRSLRPDEIADRAGRAVEGVARILTTEPRGPRGHRDRASRSRRRPSFSRRALWTARRALEYCVEQGWTDGLPVVPPERELVEDFLRVAGRSPDEVVLRNSGLGTRCTVEVAAANAVMAGCLPEYFPVVLAGLEAVDELTRDRGLLQSTTGQAVLLVVNGPIRRRLNVNCADNVLGGGTKANATIGRAVRLCLLNGLGLRPGLFDRSTQGTPAKVGLCIGENEEESPWEPLHVERGFAVTDSTVTALLIRGTMPVEHRTSRDPLHVLHNLADSMSYAGAYFQLSLAGAHLPDRAGHGSVVVLNPEHAAVLAEAGYTKLEVKRFLWEHFGRRKGDLVRFGKPHGVEEWPDDAWVRFADSPEAVTVVVAGSSNAAISTVCPTFVPQGVVRPVRVPGGVEVRAEPDGQTGEEVVV